MSHQSVLLEEAVSALVLQANGIYVDGTFGRGGHSRAILSRLDAAGRLLGLDRDPEAVTAGELLAASDRRFTIRQGSFAELNRLLDQSGLTGPVHGLLLDLGVSSPQLDQPERGFSFMTDGPLDMRMDPHQDESAADWLARATQDEIVQVLRNFGEERFAGRIARAIVTARARESLRTTRQLADLVARTVPTREPGKHPATRTFQALRIQVNRELDALSRCLDQIVERLAVGGRLVVISFHSLEDRLVKHFIRREAQGPRLPKWAAVQGPMVGGRLRPVGKAVRPSVQEVTGNPRARSAIMRVAERLP
ncbi:16S rRNA (cytosine(1402)-N(4))-methyltransferase RsmH [Caldichromatium japonicum]|uniref:16S rRNA (cytosine(1402)-N(4))-methyltransferase RsmH n=1 Tax=Caldichromatium japonicum TaxID=2699430 RepID=UPI003CCCBE68